MSNSFCFDRPTFINIFSSTTSLCIYLVHVYFSHTCTDIVLMVSPTLPTIQLFQYFFKNKIGLFLSYVMLAWTLPTVTEHIFHMRAAYVNNNRVEPCLALLPPFTFVRPIRNTPPTATSFRYSFRQISTGFELFQPFPSLALLVITADIAPSVGNRRRPWCSAKERDPPWGSCSLLIAFLRRAADEVEYIHRYHTSKHVWWVFSTRIFIPCTIFFYLVFSFKMYADSAYGLCR